MVVRVIRAIAWTNGSQRSSGAGYGIKISRHDRDRFFDPSWSAIVLQLPGQDPVIIQLSESFWKSCIELRSAAIGRWLILNGLAPWPPGSPPVVPLHKTGERAFSVRAAHAQADS